MKKKGPPPKAITVGKKLELSVWKPGCYGQFDNCPDDSFCAEFFKPCKETSCSK